MEVVIRHLTLYQPMTHIHVCIMDVATSAISICMGVLFNNHDFSLLHRQLCLVKLEHCVQCRFITVSGLSRGGGHNLTDKTLAGRGATYMYIGLVLNLGGQPNSQGWGGARFLQGGRMPP